MNTYLSYSTLSETKVNKRKKRRAKDPYQSVVETNVSLEAGANMVELHDGHFCCRDGQDVLQAWWEGADGETG